MGLLTKGAIREGTSLALDPVSYCVTWLELGVFPKYIHVPILLGENLNAAKLYRFSLCGINVPCGTPSSNSLHNARHPSKERQPPLKGVGEAEQCAQEDGMENEDEAPATGVVSGEGLAVQATFQKHSYHVNGTRLSYKLDLEILSDSIMDFLFFLMQK